MLKKYIVRLTDEERETFQQVVDKLKGSSQKVRRTRVLLKADAEGPGWTDAEIADAFDCRTKTVENIRERLVTEGFERTLHGQPRQPPCPKLLDGEGEANVSALRLGAPPPGFANWAFRLLAERECRGAIPVPPLDNITPGGDVSTETLITPDTSTETPHSAQGKLI